MKVGDLVRYADDWHEVVGIVIDRRDCQPFGSQWKVRWAREDYWTPDSHVWLAQYWMIEHAQVIG